MARIEETDAFAGFPVTEPSHRHDGDLCAVPHRGVCRKAAERDLRRDDRPSNLISLGSHFHDLRPLVDRTGPDLRARQIHGDQFAARAVAGFVVDLATSPSILDRVGFSNVPDHRFPRDGTVVGAVDACDVGAGVDHRLDEVEIGRGFGGEGHHDPRRPIFGLRTEQVLGVAVEEVGAEDHVVLADTWPLLAGHPVERAREGEQRRHDAGFEPTQRGEAQVGEFGLQLADVVAAKPDVVDEVGGTDAVFRADCVDGGRVCLLCCLRPLDECLHACPQLFRARRDRFPCQLHHSTQPRLRHLTLQGSVTRICQLTSLLSGPAEWLPGFPSNTR